MRSAYDRAIDPQMKAYLLNTINGMCRHMEYFCRAYASEAALAKARELGFELSGWDWHSQPKFDPGRETFHFEHVTTVKSIRDAVILARSEEEIAAALSRSKVAWILKDEDLELTAKGYRSNRENSDAAYEAARIKLVALD